MTDPKDFCCPISHELMKDPVVAGDGHTYERSCIEGAALSQVLSTSKGHDYITNWKWVDESYKKMSTASSQTCELKDFEPMDNFVSRCTMPEDKLIHSICWLPSSVYSQTRMTQVVRAIPKRVHPTFIFMITYLYIHIALYVYSLYISDATCTWLTLPGVIFRKWHVRMHSYRSK